MLKFLIAARFTFLDLLLASTSLAITNGHGLPLILIGLVISAVLSATVEVLSDRGFIG